MPERAFDVKRESNVCLNAGRHRGSVPAMADPTARQQRILEFIRETVRDRGYPPTVREIGEAVGLTSSSSVHAQLANLERMGLLHKDPTKPRTVALSGEPRAASVPVPLVGRIAAGAPTMADQEVDEYLALPAGYVGSGDHFALTVAGDSMVGAGIMDGDVVVLRSQDDADDGAIVAALLGGPAEDEATVKRLGHDGDRVMLIPENPSMKPFEMVDGRIVGKVVAVLRKV